MQNPTPQLESGHAPRQVHPAAALFPMMAKKEKKAKAQQPVPGKSRVGIERAHEAIACLKRIPATDALRERGHAVVTDWIRHNRDDEEAERALKKRLRELTPPTTGPTDELRSRVSTMLDQKLGWQQLYGKNGKALREVSKSADADDLKEIDRCLESATRFARS
ncbi:MAG: hypothetical protein QGG09_14950 [Pirellulaceae bacterium]|nr:hypothetical protein [Pirellulaceae bacterium]HJN08181.1 hypothetical protein [Pirellulaceae bacterium]